MADAGDAAKDLLQVGLDPDHGSAHTLQADGTIGARLCPLAALRGEALERQPAGSGQ